MYNEKNAKFTEIKKKTLNNLWTKEVIKMDIKKYFI